MNIRAAFRSLFSRDAEILEALAGIDLKLTNLIKEFHMNTAATDQNFANLQASVAKEVTVEQSAETLLAGLSAQLATAIAASNNGDSAALPALQTQIDASSAALAAAVAANTGAAPGGSTAAGS